MRLRFAGRARLRQDGRQLVLVERRRGNNGGRANATQDEQQARSNAGTGDADPCRGDRTVPRLVERRHHPPFELAWTGHSYRQCRCCASVQRIGNLEQVTGVRAGLGARGDHTVIAGQFALDSQTMGCPPDQGVEPVDGTCDLRGYLGQTVVSGHVRELVPKHGSPPVGAPGVGHCRHHDRGTAGSECHRHVQVEGAEKGHGASHAQVRFTLREQIRPLRVGDCCSPAAQPANGRVLHRQANEHRGADQCVDPYGDR